MSAAPEPKETVSRQRYEREREARKAAEKMLEERSRQLYEAERGRASFLAMLSQELKTPLNGILGSAQILDDHVDASSHKHVHAILESGTTLNAQIESLLCLAELRAGEAEVELSPVLLQGLMSRVADAFEQMAVKKDLTIRLTLDDELKRPVMADRKRIRQILTALVSNAVKYTPQGVIGISARQEEDGFALHVSDSGAGVPVDRRKKIFEEYLSEESFRTRSFGGAGLALPVIREAVKLLGGDIEVSDSMLGGACFSVHLPAEFSSRREVALEKNAGRSKDSLRVLIVDDNKLNRVLTRYAVTTAGLRWAEACNGAEAIDLLDRESFDLILMDVHMPIMSGDEAIRRIRARKSPDCNTPIIVLTAQMGSEDIGTYTEIGADHTIQKPVEFEKLLRSMENVMGLKLVAS